MTKPLIENAVKKGVEICYKTLPKEIIREGNGPVKGVIVEDKGGKRKRVDGKAVVLATGGYANNKEWIKKYTGFDLGVNLFAAMGIVANKMGEGIQMACDIGAAQEGMEVLQIAGGSFRVPGASLMQLLVTSQQPYIWINQPGKRFCGEDVAHNFTFTGNVISRQKGGYIFSVIDGDIMQHLIKNGIDVGGGNYLPVTYRLTKLEDELKRGLEKGSTDIFVADSLDELADKMKVDPAVFKKTVEQYNRFCAKGHDDQFAKTPKYLLPIKKPKFYAFKRYPIFLGTLGGININEKTEVLDKNKDAIPGLYAVGNIVGGIYGDSYDLEVAAGATTGH